MICHRFSFEPCHSMKTQPLPPILRKNLRCTGSSLIASAFLLISGSTQGANIFTGFHSFGDSLTDSGNVFTATGGAFGYPGGRFSNGPTWAEQLAIDYLGFASHAPTILGGTNHAWGGARSADVVPPLDLLAVPPSINRQIAIVGSEGVTFTATDLVSIWGGPNDFLDSAASGLGLADPATSATNIGTAIDAVLALGAEHVLVPNLPNLGDTPRFSGSLLEGAASVWTDDFNTSLALEIDARRGPGVTLYEVDIYALNEDLQMNPAQFGITNLSDPVFPANTLDPATSAYWDDVHPTEVVHGIFALEAATVLGIPEPSSLLLVLFAPVFLLGRRRQAS